MRVKIFHMIPYKLKNFVQSVLTPRKYMQSTFAPFYTENRWGDSESASGPGSNLVRTAKLRNELPILLEEIGARSMLDAPCGDFNWMKETVLALEEYIGVDLIPDIFARNQSLYANKRTRFVLLDLTRDELPRVDVILCRDCFIHFSYRHINAAIRNFKRSGSTYLLTNTVSRVAPEREHSYRRFPSPQPSLASLQLSPTTQANR